MALSAMVGVDLKPFYFLLFQCFLLKFNVSTLFSIGISYFFRYFGLHLGLGKWLQCWQCGNGNLNRKLHLRIAKRGKLALMTFTTTPTAKSTTTINGDEPASK
nr:uncharacterized protein LOC118681085 [Bactrocera oleae]